MNFFSGKVIFVFSPQPWNYLQLSKHHYARALAKLGHVYFICPPDFGWWPSMLTYSEGNRLTVVQPVVPLPGLIRVRWKRAYQKLYTVLFQILSARLPRPHVVFDFGCYSLFHSMDFLKNGMKIFFPVDDFADLDSQKRGAKFVFTVSSAIWKKFTGNHCILLNHGLSDEFAELAHSEIRWRRSGKLKVGCSGNLFIRFLDYEILKQIVLEHPNVEFHFFGSTTMDPNISWHPEWNNFLLTTPNVKLFGVVAAKQLVDYYTHLDAFILAYKPDYINYHGENSHKVLEYLSSGRVIVSTFLSNYDNSNLLQMAPRDQNGELPQVFRMVIDDLDRHNAHSIAQERKMYALENTYDRQIELISNVIANAG